MANRHAFRFGVINEQTDAPDAWIAHVRRVEAWGYSTFLTGVRIQRLGEAIAVLKGLFAEAPLTFAGTHYTISNLNGFPKPTQRPHPPILIGAGHKRMLMLAGREANTVGILTTSVATGRVVDDPLARMADRVAEQIAWVRAGAGARFDEIELSTVATLIITDQRRARAEQWIRERGWSGVTVEQV